MPAWLFPHCPVRRRAFRAPRIVSGLLLLAAGAAGGTPLGVCRVDAQQTTTRPDTIVKQAAAPRHAGVARLVPELTIGVVDGAPEYTFAAVTDVLPLHDGTVLVLEVPPSGTPSLRRYDAAGRHMRNIGRAGQGPGEYRGPNGLAQLADGRILLYDSPGRRINVYSREGESTDTWMLPPLPVSSGGTANLRVGSGGAVYLQASLLDRDATSPDQRFQRVVLRLQREGTVIDTILPQLPHVEVPSVTRTQTSGSGSSTSTLTAPYSPQAVWTWSPLGYMVTGITSRYAFELRVPRSIASQVSGEPPLWRRGDPVLSIRRSTAPVPVSRAERSDQRARMQAQFDRASGRVTGSMPDVPEVKPAYKRLLIGDDGRVWVHISTPSEKYDPETEPGTDRPGGISGAGLRAPSPSALRGLVPPAPWREPAVYDVFEPDGTWIGQVGVPWGTRILNMNGDVVWGEVRDDDDVPVVKRFRIAWN